jgi:hypothetical protein
MATTSSVTFNRTELASFFAGVKAIARSSLADPSPNTHLQFSRHVLADAFVDLHARLASHQRERAQFYRCEAPKFNVFDFIQPSENTLSDILQFLVDPESSHGQGGLFLKLLLERVDPGLALDVEHAIVAREALTFTILARHRRIDLVITLAGFTLALENKKFADEGPEQIHDYCAHLRNLVGERFSLIFLSHSGAEAASIAPELAATYKQKGQLSSWSWAKDMRTWLDVCSQQCESAKVRHFLADFQAYIAEYLATAEALPEKDE